MVSSSLDALNKYKAKEKVKEKRTVVLNNELEFEVYFTKNANSIYAHYDPMNLIAGSQTKDEKEAKIKAVMRLVQMIEIRLDSYKKDGSFNKLFVEEVEPKTKEKFIDYAMKSDLSFPYENSKKKIPVFDEEFSVSGNEYKFGLTLKGYVTNLKTIQRSHCESVEVKNKKTISVNYDETNPSNLCVNISYSMA
ncbi:MAG: hypothetical protein OEZ36_06080 [Spirochaetota bacterium]|nr:hypothetical protein [Spirochaetota bacterium]